MADRARNSFQDASNKRFEIDDVVFPHDKHHTPAILILIIIPMAAILFQDNGRNWKYYLT